AHIRELAAWFKNNNVKPHSLHSPMFYDEEEFGRGPMEPINIVETDRKRQIEATDEIKRALECAEHIPFRFLVQHLGNGNESFDVMKHNPYSTHLHDNAGMQDSHLWPGEGKVDWGECTSLLRSAHHGLPLLLEIDGEKQGDVNNKFSSAFSFLEKQATVKSV